MVECCPTSFPFPSSLSYWVSLISSILSSLFFPPGSWSCYFIFCSFSFDIWSFFFHFYLFPPFLFHYLECFLSLSISSLLFYFLIWSYFFFPFQSLSLSISSSEVCFPFLFIFFLCFFILSLFSFPFQSFSFSFYFIAWSMLSFPL